MAAARWLLPPPGGPNSSRLAPFSSQLSPAASAMTWALEIIGTASKSKVSRVLPGRQAGLGEMALDAAAVALGQLVLGDRGEEAGGGPAFLVGLFGELRPDELDGGQAQLVEEQAEPGGIDGVVGLHAASPVRLAPIRAS